MKIRHILLNILPLPLWLGYYLSTISSKELVITPFDETVYLIVIIAFTIYNLFSKKVFEFLVRNLICIISITVGCLISGQKYLELCYHMSDEHDAAKSIPYDMAYSAFLLTVIVGMVVFFVKRKS